MREHLLFTPQQITSMAIKAFMDAKAYYERGEVTGSIVWHEYAAKAQADAELFMSYLKE